jgi:hypothetical protein
MTSVVRQPIPSTIFDIATTGVVARAQGWAPGGNAKRIGTIRNMVPHGDKAFGSLYQGT